MYGFLRLEFVKYMFEDSFGLYKQNNIKFLFVSNFLLFIKVFHLKRIFSFKSLALISTVFRLVFCTVSPIFILTFNSNNQ